jgi:hypothetical protein
VHLLQFYKKTRASCDVRSSWRVAELRLSGTTKEKARSRPTEHPAQAAERRPQLHGEKNRQPTGPNSLRRKSTLPQRPRCNGLEGEWSILMGEAATSQHDVFKPPFAPSLLHLQHRMLDWQLILAPTRETTLAGRCESTGKPRKEGVHTWPKSE